MGGILDAIANYNPTGYVLDNKQKAANLDFTSANTAHARTVTEGEQLKNQLEQQALRDQEIYRQAMAESLNQPAAQAPQQSQPLDPSNPYDRAMVGAGVVPQSQQQPQGTASTPNRFSDPVGFAQYLARRGASGSFVQGALKSSLDTHKAIMAMPLEERNAEDARLVPVQRLLEGVLQTPDGQQRQQAYAQVLPQIQQIDPHVASMLSPQFDNDALMRALTEANGLKAHLEYLKTQADTSKLTAEMPGIEAANQIKQQEAEGKKPIQPYEQAQLTNTQQAHTETTRHNRVEEQHGAATAGETVRHNRAEEALKRLEVDPFGAAGGAAVSGGAAHGDEFLKTLPPAAASQVKALAEGRLQFPAGMALRSPYWQAMLSRVSQYDPTFDAVNYNSRAKTRAAFTSGREAQSVNALNTVIGHLDSLSQQADKLNNSSFPAYNSLANWAASNVGDPRVKEFEANKKAVVDELTRVWRGVGGSEGDIKSWADTLNASQSPQQMHGVAAKMGELLQSKMDALGEQYRQGMGTTEQGLTLLTPQAQRSLAKLQGKAGPGTNAAPAKIVVKAGDGSVHPFDNEQQAKSFEALVKSHGGSTTRQ